MKGSIALRVRRLIGPALAGALVGLVAGGLLTVSYDCIQHWYVVGSADPRCVYRFKRYVQVYERDAHGAAKIYCRYDPNYPTDVLSAAP